MRDRFSSLPTASGAIARAAYARALEARLEVGPLLKSSTLTPDQINNSHFRMPVQSQIKFLDVVADELQDQFVGVHIAESIDLRENGISVLRHCVVRDTRRCVGEVGEILQHHQ